MGAYFFTHFLDFALNAVGKVTENKERFVTKEQFGVDQILDAVIIPAVICLFLLLSVAVVNNRVDDLLKTCATFSLFQRTKETQDKKLIKELHMYTKSGNFTFNIFDHPVKLSTVSKIIALSVSMYIILLRFKRWGII